MRSLPLVLAAALLATVATAPAEAGRCHKNKKARCCRSDSQKTGCAADTGYRAAEWGTGWYHVNENCKAVAQIPKEKLVTDLPATYGRRRHCCGGCK